MCLQVGGSRLNLNHFHTTSPSQQAVLKMTYCLKSLTGNTYYLKDKQDKQTPSALVNSSSDARVYSYTFNLTKIICSYHILFYSSISIHSKNSTMISQQFEYTTLVYHWETLSKQLVMEVNPSWSFTLVKVILG